MASGFSVGSVCYAVQQDAIDAFYSAVQPAYLSLNSITYRYQYAKVSATEWDQQIYSLDAAGTQTLTYSVAAPVNVVGACTVPNDAYTNFTDGMTLGWGVATAMILVYVIRRVHR